VTRVRKYCPHCRRTVLFADSLKRRQNANGKTIYEFAIYKCDRDHTWNRKLSVYHADQKDVGHPNGPAKKEYGNPDAIQLKEYRRHGYGTLEIRLDRVTGKWRMDSLLSQYIADLSRTQIKRMIRNEHIIIDGHGVRAGSLVRTNQTILLSLRDIAGQIEHEE